MSTSTDDHNHDATDHYHDYDTTDDEHHIDDHHEHDDHVPRGAWSWVRYGFRRHRPSS